MAKKRKIFFVVASGGQDTDRHYYDTIERKRTLEEIQPFLTDEETSFLKSRYQEGLFAVWGAVPGPGNLRNWTTMDAGDYVLIYKKGAIIFAAEVALKVRSPKAAEYFWGKNEEGQTWEYMYFLVNAESVHVPMDKLNPYLGYKETYSPQGFGAIEQSKVDQLLESYGDILSALKKIESGKKLKEVVSEATEEDLVVLKEKIEKAPTEHTEMQWRLIRLGKKMKVDVWVPPNDQGRSYEGNDFRKEVIQDFQETLDVPPTIKNIDVVWKYGYSIKSAFEIENSTSIYSGILRLSDLRALTPNSVYPLFIVADREKRDKVLKQLQRPTFKLDCLNLKEVIAFLDYDKIREIDEAHKQASTVLKIETLMEQSEKP